MEIRDLKKKYLLLSEKYKILSLKHKKILFTLSLLRLLVFAGGLAIAIICFSFSPAAGIFAIILSVVIFLFLVNQFAIHSEKREFFGNLENVNRNEINSLSGDLSPFNNGSIWINSDHDFSNDIDLFGQDSLFHFLNRTVTGYGRDTLALWLARPYKISAEIRQRQETISELSAKLDWRQEFIANGTGKSLGKDDIEGVLQWLNDHSEFYYFPFLKIAIWLFPGLTLTSLLMLIAGYLPYQIFTIFFLINLLLILAKLKDTKKIHDQVSKKHEFLSSFNRLLSSFEKESYKAVILNDFKTNFSSGNQSALSRIGKLSRIIRSFDSRLNMLIGFVLTVFVDLTMAIEVGIVFSAMLFMQRMSKLSSIESVDIDNDILENYSSLPIGVDVFEITGPFFFAAAQSYKETLKQIAGDSKVLILRMRYVPFIDSTGILIFQEVIRDFRIRKVTIVLSGVRPEVRQTIEKCGLAEVIGHDLICDNFGEAVKKAIEELEKLRRLR